jgi:hypothetical protein
MYLSYGSTKLNISKQIQENFIEKTCAYKTIQARKEAAAEAGMVLNYSKDSEDFPNTEMNQLEIEGTKCKRKWKNGHCCN